MKAYKVLALITAGLLLWWALSLNLFVRASHHKKHALPNVEEAANKINWGRVEFEPPAEFEYGKATTITMTLTAFTGARALDQIIDDEAKAAGYTHIKTSDLMEAELIGDAFSITSEPSKRQPVRPGNTNTWQWDVRPKRIGAEKLHLWLNAVVKIHDIDATSTVRVVNHDVSIRLSSAASFLALAWDQWTLVAGVVAGVAAVIARRRSNPGVAVAD